MIYAAVLAASLTIFFGALWMGWFLRGLADGDRYAEGYEAALEATAWLNYEDTRR